MNRECKYCGKPAFQSRGAAVCGECAQARLPAPKKKKYFYPKIPRPCKRCGSDINQRYSRFCDDCLKIDAIPKPEKKCEVCGKPLKTKQRYRCKDHAIGLTDYNPRSEINDTASSAEVVRLYASGLNMGRVAREVGISRQRVHQLLHKLGISIRKKESGNRIAFDIVKAIEMQESGTPIEQIAKEFGCHEATIRLKLKAFILPEKRDQRPGFRHCFRCDEWKSTDQFFKVGYICRPCNTIRMREYVRANREKHNAWQREYNRRRKAAKTAKAS